MKYLIFLICLALPAYLIRFSILGIPTTLLEILIYIAFVIGLFNLKKASKIDSKIWWPIGLLLIAALISTWTSPDHRVALGEFKAFFIDPLIVFWLVVTFLRQEDFGWVFWGLAGSSVIVSVHAVIQKIIGNVTADGRVVGIFGYSPNYLALFLTPLIALAAARSLELMTKKIDIAHKMPKIIIGWAVVVLGLIALNFSGSRAAFLALAGGLVFYLIIHFWAQIKSKLWLKTIIAVFIIAMIAFAWQANKPNFNLSPATGGRITSSNNIRAQIWQATWELGLKHPLLGVGLGNFQNAFNELTKNRTNFTAYITPWALSPHNIFLDFWLNTGILGLVAFIWILFIFYLKGLKDYQNPIKVFLMTAMTALILQGLVDTPYFKNDLSLIFWLMLAFVIKY